MAIINLRDFYPYYTMDSFIEVPDEVAEAMAEFDRKEASYRLRTYRHKAYYSLDREDGIEHSALFVALSPCEIYERKVTMQELYAAISSLPGKQAKRIYAHFVLGMSKTDIARAEGVDEKVVRLASQHGDLKPEAAGASGLCQMSPSAFSVRGNRMLLCMEICKELRYNSVAKMFDDRSLHGPKNIKVRGG